MKRRYLHQAFACFAIIAAISPLCAVPTEPVKQVTDGNEVQLQLSSTQLLVGEPLMIMLRVTNINSPIRVANFGLKPNFSEGNDLEVIIHRPGELPARYEGATSPGMYSAQEQNLSWGDSVHLEYPILYDRTQPNGYVFPKAGDYTVDVRVHTSILRDPQERVIAQNGVKISVSEPTGPAAEAFKLINNPAAAMALHQLSTDNQEILKNARTIGEKYPDTPYAPLCLYLLGASELAITGGKIDNALTFFTTFLRRYPTHIRTSSVIYNIVMAHFRSRRHDLGRDWYYYLKDHDPSYFLLRRENPIAAHYYFTPEEQAKGRKWWLYEKPWDIPPPPPDQNPSGPPQPTITTSE